VRSRSWGLSRGLGLQPLNRSLIWFDPLEASAQDLHLHRPFNGFGNLAGIQDVLKFDDFAFAARPADFEVQLVPSGSRTLTISVSVSKAIRKLSVRKLQIVKSVGRMPQWLCHPRSHNDLVDKVIALVIWSSSLLDPTLQDPSRFEILVSKNKLQFIRAR
jgi:hypothetical protein